MARFPKVTEHTLIAPLRATLLDHYGARKLERQTLEAGTPVQVEHHGDVPADVAALVEYGVIRVQGYRYSVRLADLRTALHA